MRNTRRNRLLLGKSTKNGGQEKFVVGFTDQFGMCWQVYPKILVDMMNDAEKAPKAVEAFQKMIKFDIQALLDAVK